MITTLRDSNIKIPIDMNFKLIAGPGAGKTFFLAHHINDIAQFSKKLSSLNKIACITYTNIGVEELQKNLNNTKGIIEVSTIHSFLYYNVIKPFLWILLDEFPKINIPRINGHDVVIPSYSILEEWKRQTTQFNLDDNSKVKEALSYLRWILKDGELLLDFVKSFQGQAGKYKIRKNSYLDYKKICWEHGLIDHEDVLGLSYKILRKEPKIISILCKKFPYILVDEFQDTNPIQSILIKLLAESGSYVGVIGDPCQSIFSFQGATKEQFDSFVLPNMQSYKIEGNRRSTTQIIKVINKIRNDDSFMQSSVLSKKGEKPIIIIGTYRNSREKIKIILELDDLVVLARKNEDCFVLSLDKGGADKDLKRLENTFYLDGIRGMLIKYVIESLSYCQVFAYSDAIHSIKKAFRKDKSFNPERDPILTIKKLLAKVSDYENITISKFCNEYLCVNGGFIPKITRGKASEIYSKWTVKEAICLNSRVSDTLMQPRTIHSVKGDEFNDVLVVFPSSSFNENEDLGFLISPNMEDEEHRICYVALSRAKKRIFINVPNLSKEHRAIIGDLFEIVDLVDEE